MFNKFALGFESMQFCSKFNDRECTFSKLKKNWFEIEILQNNVWNCSQKLWYLGIETKFWT